MTDVSEPLVIDIDPDPRKRHKSHPVIVRIEVPPKATSSGWGDMSWLKRRC